MHFKSNCEGSHRISFALRNEHKFRDPLLRTKSNFPFVRSPGKGSRVQRVPPKTHPLATISSALSIRSPRDAGPLTRASPNPSFHREKRFESDGTRGRCGWRVEKITPFLGWWQWCLFLSSFKRRKTFLMFAEK